ncbi:MAG TPA: AIM24 family protein [Acidimicrobiales bacterium]|nr:AIM24 family protein [Acidimicrobiales bacterium]
MKSDIFSNTESTQTDAFTLQNSKMLKVRLGLDGNPPEMLARQGAMVAYQGQAQFDYQGAGGLGKMLKQKLTGEGVATMRVSGQAEVFFADQASDIHLILLEGDAISINGRNVLAYQSTLEADVHFVGGGGMAAGGLFNTIIQGHGWIAVTSKGSPVVLSTDSPTFVDSNAVVAWSANLQTSVASSFKLGNLIGRGSGEALQIGFQGQGWVIVQPSEFDLATMNQGGQNTGPAGGAAGGGIGGGLGGLLGR